MRQKHQFKIYLTINKRYYVKFQEAHEVVVCLMNNEQTINE